MSFAQGGTSVPRFPFYVLSVPFLSCLPALSVVVGGGGQVYAWDWGVGAGGLVL